MIKIWWMHTNELKQQHLEKVDQTFFGKARRKTKEIAKEDASLSETPGSAPPWSICIGQENY